MIKSQSEMIQMAPRTNDRSSIFQNHLGSLENSVALDISGEAFLPVKTKKVIGQVNT